MLALTLNISFSSPCIMIKQECRQIGDLLLSFYSLNSRFEAAVVGLLLFSLQQTECRTDATFDFFFFFFMPDGFVFASWLIHRSRSLG